MTERSVRLTASYPASDGSMPETVEVTWDGYLPTTGEIAVLLDVLGALPNCRHVLPLLPQPEGPS